MEYLFHKNYLKNSRSCRHFRRYARIQCMKYIHGVPLPSSFFKTFVKRSRRVGGLGGEKIEYIRSFIRCSMSTTNDGFECYSRGGFAKFEHESLERGMREAIVCGKVSRQNVNPTRGQGFTLHPDLYLSTSDTFHPSEEKSLQRILPTSFLPFVFSIFISCESRSEMRFW